MKSREDTSVDENGAEPAADRALGADKAAGAATKPSLRRREPMGWFLSRTRKTIRLTTYIFVVSLIGAMLLARSGYARIKGSALRFGDELTRLTDATQGGDYYRLRMNGELMNIATAKTSMPFKDVLQRFKDACGEGADGLPDKFAHLDEALKPDAPVAAKGWPGMGVFREISGNRGVVLCFATGGPTDYAAAFDRMREFAETGDLSKVGDLRYVFARETAQGGAHVVAAWTEGSFAVGKMFPSEGDAPGNDVSEAVRPDGTRRIFGAYAEGVPYGIRIYEGATPPSMILDQYDREMPRKGWETITPVGKRLPSSRAFSREGVDLLISVASHQTEADKSVISVIEMRAQ